MPDVRLTTEGTVECTAHLMKSGNWLGECEALGIYIEADDLNDLYSQFHESIALLIRDLIEEGELHAFLKERGWTSDDSGWLHDAAQKDPATVVPWRMIAPGQPDAFTYEVAQGFEVRSQKCATLRVHN